MKKFKKLAAIVMVLSMALAMVACGKKDSIVGTWEATEDGVTLTYEFQDGGKGKVSVSGMSMDITWKTDGDKLTVTMELLGEKSEDEYTYSVKGSELTLTQDGESATLKKK